MTTDISRRSLLSMTAALGGAALLGGAGLTRFATPARAAAALEIPTVDKLDIRVLIDASHDIFQRKTEARGVISTPSGVSNGGSFDRVLHNQWGLSLFLDSQRADEKKGILLDFGYSPEALLNNIELLEVDPARFDSIVVSHGHFDHFGGLQGLVEKYGDRLPKPLKLYAGGEDNFCLRVRGADQPQLTDAGAINRDALQKLGTEIVLAEQPTLVAGHAFTSGRIERRTTEKVLGNGQVFFGHREDGLGCDASGYAASGDVGQVVKDEHHHEHATSFHVKDRGLVVIGSCSHSGIVNAVKQAQAVSGIDKVHAIVGGFHLGPAPDDYLKEVVDLLATIDFDVIIPMHCSGANFANAAKARFPGQVLDSSTGNLFTFGA